MREAVLGALLVLTATGCGRDGGENQSDARGAVPRLGKKIGGFSGSLSLSRR
jgi:hypothetical protein